MSRTLHRTLLLPAFPANLSHFRDVQPLPGWTLLSVNTCPGGTWKGSVAVEVWGEDEIPETERVGTSLLSPPLGVVQGEGQKLAQGCARRDMLPPRLLGVVQGGDAVLDAQTVAMPCTEISLQCCCILLS